jgi:hypothetical protein
VFHAPLTAQQTWLGTLFWVVPDSYGRCTGGSQPFRRSRLTEAMMRRAFSFCHRDVVVAWALGSACLATPVGCARYFREGSFVEARAVQASLYELDEPRLRVERSFEAYRLYVPGQLATFVIRVERVDGVASVVAKVRDDTRRPTSVSEHRRLLTASDWQALQAIVSAADYWRMPSGSEAEELILHDDVCIIEGVDGRVHHVVSRGLSTTTDQYSRLCAKLFELARLQHPFRSSFTRPRGRSNDRTDPKDRSSVGSGHDAPDVVDLAR